MKNNTKIKFELSSSMLHIMAMSLMLLDHLWATVIPGKDWMTTVGRLAFPIFAFMIAEGFFHTKNFSKYMLRLLILAVVSEIPFNLIYGGSFFYPFHQNVIWTFLLSLLTIKTIEKVKEKLKLPFAILVSAALVIIAICVGYLGMMDYYGAGVATVLTFYFFHKRNWWCFLAQVLILGYINFELIGGFCYSFTVFGHQIEVLRQGVGILALIPIWLYKGKQGFHNKIFSFFCYAFYPAHILVLALLMLK